MNYVVGVSGGVDSVALLDILSRDNSKRLIVAHVDHGIRDESSDDERFVRALAKKYSLPYVSTNLSLGEDASEELARQARYDFLFEVARQHDAKLATAHHQDDVIGSIAINLERGTGWRGLAVMNRPNIERPLLGWTKRSIYDYANRARLEWVEDATNQSDKYLRNRLRRQTMQLPADTQSRLAGLRASQLQLARDVRREIDKVLLKFGDSRYHYSAIDNQIASELLKTRFGITKPQAEALLLAIKTAKAGSTYVVNKQLQLRFTKTDFIVDSHL